MHIGILGCGIVGLNTALRLQEEFPNAQLTLIADGFEEETTSYVAAGIFRPGTQFSGPSPEITKRWIHDSYNFYDELLQSDQSGIAGISEVSGYIYASQHEFITRNHFLEGLLPTYRQVTEDELHLCPGNWKYGSYFTTLVIGSEDFMPWAKKKFENGGGRIMRQKIESFRDLADASPRSKLKFDAVFNCTGFGSKWLCNDVQVVPVRGQVIKVRAPWIKMFFYGDYDTYVVPGKRAVTLGGSRQYESYNTSVSEFDSSAIWQNCTSLVPSLKKATFVKELVGLRPHRAQVRVEIEEFGTDTNKLMLIHNYGHGGYGVMTAPGTAKYAVELFQQSLRAGNGNSGGPVSYQQNYSLKCPSKL